MDQKARGQRAPRAASPKRKPEAEKSATNPETWLPLSQRGTASRQALFQGIPDHLVPSLRIWLTDLLDPKDTDAMMATMLDPLATARRISTLGRRIRRPLETAADIHDLLLNDDVAALDLIDAVVAQLEGARHLAERIRDLEIILQDGGSAYTVHCGQPHWQLVARVNPSVARRAGESTAGTSSTAAHLASAWTALYGLHPDHTRAVLEASKALEAAARPVITPKDGRATLGKMIKALRDKPSKWTTSAGTVEQLTDALQVVWDLRVAHGEPDRVITVDSRAADAAVHLALTYCHWLTAGLVNDVK